MLLDRFMDTKEIKRSLLSAQSLGTLATTRSEKPRMSLVHEDFLPDTMDLAVHRRVGNRLDGDGIKVIEQDGGILIQGTEENGTIRFWKEYAKEKGRGPIRRAIAEKVWAVRKIIQRRQLSKLQA